MGMSAGWTNALLFYYGPRVRLLQMKPVIFIFYLLQVGAAASIYSFLFSQKISKAEIGFLAGGLSLFLFAPLFAIEFLEGNYPWVYKRVVASNTLLACAAATGIIWGKEALLWSTFVVGLLVTGYWATDRAAAVPLLPKERISIRPWLNPAVPILERAVWDQWMLVRFQAPSLSLPVYVLGKCITLFGNTLYSFLWGKMGEAPLEVAAKRKRIELLWAFGVILAASTLITPYAAILFGQFLAWAATALFTINYNQKREWNHYVLLLAAWALDFFLRLAVLAKTQSFDQYASVVSITSLPLFFFFWWFSRKYKRSGRLVNPSPSLQE
jgi:hypothetical protein